MTLVRSWPVDQRSSLVQDVLATLAPEASSIQQRQPTLGRALGLLETEEPAPTDAEIGNLLAERRRERCGLDAARRY